MRRGISNLSGRTPTRTASHHPCWYYGTCNSLGIRSQRTVPTKSTSIRSSSSSSTAAGSSHHQKQKQQPFCLLDLRDSGLSVIERLCLKECLLRHDHRQWMIWGTHCHPTKSKKNLVVPPNNDNNMPSYLLSKNQHQKRTINDDNNNDDDDDPCIVVMGIGGKPALLLNIERVREDGIWVIKRFSGGGTVVVDRNCLYTTIIGRTNHLGDVVPPYPREIMAWTATEVFEPLFRNLKEMAIVRSTNEQQQQHPVEQDYPEFSLRENDYVLGSTQKVAGNAQSIVKTGFLHHTTFLWSYKKKNMEYLTLPAKRPAYRKDRSHSNFLIQLKDAYHDQLVMGDFFDSLERVCHDTFDVEKISLNEALTVVQDVVGPGGLQAFFETKSRTRLIDIS